MTQRVARPAVTRAELARVFNAETFSAEVAEGIVAEVDLPLHGSAMITNLAVNLNEAVKTFVHDLSRESAEGRRSVLSRATRVERLLSEL